MDKCFFSLVKHAQDFSLMWRLRQGDPFSPLNGFTHRLYAKLKAFADYAGFFLCKIQNIFEQDYTADGNRRFSSFKANVNTYEICWPVNFTCKNNKSLKRANWYPKVFNFIELLVVHFSYDKNYRKWRILKNKLLFLLFFLLVFFFSFRGGQKSLKEGLPAAER